MHTDEGDLRMAVSVLDESARDGYGFSGRDNFEQFADCAYGGGAVGHLSSARTRVACPPPNPFVVCIRVGHVWIVVEFVDGHRLAMSEAVRSGECDDPALFVEHVEA